MTSNVGSREMTTRAIGFERGVSGGGQREVEKLFSPEFRNRLDETVNFQSLTPEVMERVVDKFIREIEGQLREKRVSFDLSPEARAWLAERGYDPLYGARPLARVIQSQLNDRIANELLFGKLMKGGRVRVDADGDGLRLQFEPRTA
jgi:ATP-dependent Clp protease ATP-binding subunit ClpA